MSVDLAPQNFYRLNLGVSYPSLASWQISLGHYTSNTLYNSGNTSTNFSLNSYVPIHIGNFPLSWQLGSSGTCINRIQVAQL